MYANQTLAQLLSTLMYSLATLALITVCSNRKQPTIVSPSDEPTPSSTASAPPQQQPATDLPRDELPRPGKTTGPAPTEAEQEKARNQLREAENEANQATFAIKLKRQAMNQRTLSIDNALQGVSQQIAKIEACLKQANEAQTKVPEARSYLPNIQTLLALAKVVKAATQSAGARLKAEDAVANSDPNAAAIIANAESVIDQAYKAAQAAAEEEIGIEVPSEGFVNLVVNAITNSRREDRATTASAQRYLRRIQEDQNKVAKLHDKHLNPT